METLPLEQIDITGGTRLRFFLNDDHVEDIIAAWNNIDALPPVVVFWDGVTFWLADGHHRCEAAQRSGRLRINVEIHDGSRRDAILYACGANRKDGLCRTRADKRKACGLLLEDHEWGVMSDRWIATKVGVTPEYVALLRNTMVLGFVLPEGPMPTKKSLGAWAFRKDELEQKRFQRAVKEAERQRLAAARAKRKPKPRKTLLGHGR